MNNISISAFQVREGDLASYGGGFQKHGGNIMYGIGPPNFSKTMLSPFVSAFGAPAAHASPIMANVKMESAMTPSSGIIAL